MGKSFVKKWRKMVNKTLSNTLPPWDGGKTYKTYVYKSCHKGNTAILQIPEKGKLYVGGWSRGAEQMDGMAVVDLTGNHGDNFVWSTGGFERTLITEAPFLPTEPWLSLYVADFKAPVYPRETWEALAEDILDLLNRGTDVLIACSGGHGRTGTAAAILAGLIIPSDVGDQPITWLRKLYCDHAVESKEQVEYVYSILGITPPKMEEPAKAELVSYFGGGKDKAGTSGVLDKIDPRPPISGAIGSPYYWETWDMDDYDVSTKDDIPPDCRLPGWGEV